MALLPHPAVVKSRETKGEKDLPIIERLFHVRVNPGYLVGSFFADNRGWVYPALLVPLLAALSRWLWQRQQGLRPPEDPNAGPDAGDA